MKTWRCGAQQRLPFMRKNPQERVVIFHVASDESGKEVYEVGFLASSVLRIQKEHVGGSENTFMARISGFFQRK